jgi:pantoate--beta-alanine ligase
VATVVSILFNIVRPQIAVFGEKDFQQLLVIRKMVKDLHYPIEIVGVETERDDDGLALSSRNQRLSPEQRRQARALPEALAQMAEQLRAGNVEYRQLEQQATDQLQRAGFEVDYVAVRDAEDLTLPQPGRALVVLGAARLGATRLLDAHRV